MIRLNKPLGQCKPEAAAHFVNDLGRAIANVLPPGSGPGATAGFVVVVFDFEGATDPDKSDTWVASNATKRSAIDTLREAADRLEAGLAVDPEPE